MPTLIIRCGKANEAWLRNALSTQTEVPISQIIDLAIQYHHITGKFLPLGTVSIKEENPQCIQKRLYFRNSSPVMDIVKSERELNSKMPKDVISEVLLGGLEIGESTQYMTAEEYTRALFSFNKLSSGQGTLPTPAAVVTRNPQSAEKTAKRSKVTDEDIADVVSSVNKEQNKATHKTQRIGFADSFITSF